MSRLRRALSCGVSPLPCGTILRHLFIHLTTVVPFANGGRVARCSEYSRKGISLMFLFCDISCLLGGSRKGLALKGLVPDIPGSGHQFGNCVAGM